MCRARDSNLTGKISLNSDSYPGRAPANDAKDDSSYTLLSEFWKIGDQIDYFRENVKLAPR